MAYVAALGGMLLLRLFFREDTKKSRRAFAVGACLILCFFAALRAPSVGRDTASFIEVFLKLRGRTLLDMLKFSSWVEPGFRLLAYLVGLFTANGQWLVIITALIINISVSVFLYRNARNVYLGFFLYVLMMLYPFYFSMMRQALAVCCLLFAYDCLRRRRLVGCYLLLLLAASFHTSALLFLPLPLLSLVRVSKKLLLRLLPAVAILSVAAAIFVRPLIALFVRVFPRYAEYNTADTFLALYLFLGVFLAVTLYGIFKLYFGKGASDLPPAEGFDERGFLTLLMLCGVVVAAMMTQFGQIQRVFNYFEVLYLLYLPLALPAAYYDKRARRLAVPPETAVALCLALCYFLPLLFLRSGVWYDAVPYRFFWQG